MFGQSGNASFSGFNTAAQTSPFGQSAFSKPITTASFGNGTTSLFGTGNTSLFSSKPAGSTTGGLFAGTTTPPAFRQTTSTQPSFGSFGTTNTNTNLFGTQPNTGTNLFGTSTATSAFGQANRPGGFSFGASTGNTLFGQPQQATQQSTPFGQTNTTTNTNLFGTTVGFGNTNTTAQPITGTVIKFQPVITSDSITKNGISHTVSGRHNCIVSMKEYEGKSYDELRYEDYSVGRKGPGQGPSTGLFGQPAQSIPFGNAAAGTSTTATGFGGMTGGFACHTTQSGTPGLFGKPITSFGTPATTTTNNFAFNSTPTSNLFGTNTQAKPFGTAAPTPLFATSNTNQTAGTGFGGINTTQNTGFGTTFGSTQPNQSIGLFAQNKSPFNIPSTSSATSFTGFGQTPASNTGTSLFAKPTGTTGAFGTTSTFGATTPSTFGTNTGFGAPQNTGTTLFNTPFKLPGPTMGFSFGPTQASSTGLGATTGLSLGGGSTLFGQQKPGGLFGNTGTNTTFSNPGGFGSTSPFGTNTNTLPGLGTSLPGGGTSTIQAKPPGTFSVHQQILALVSAPFGDSPLLKNLLPASGKTEELLKPANPASKILNSPQYKVTANTKSPKIKARVVSSAQLTKKSLFEGLEEEDPMLSEAFQPRPNAKRLVLGPKPVTNSTTQLSNENSQSLAKNSSKEDDSDITVFQNGIESTNKENQLQDNRQFGNDRRSSTSWLKSTLPRKAKVPDDEHFEGERSPFSGTNATDESVNNTVAELRPNTNLSNQNHSDLNNSSKTALNSSYSDKNTSDVAAHNTDSSQELEDRSFSMLQPNWNSNAAKVILRRVGYYTIPSLDKLDDYVRGESCVVPNFTVGREGYGNVYFPESFDIYGLNLDEIVHFRHKEVIIYPDDEKKPPIGQGLNRKAQVTLDRVWPHDKSLHEPITDPHRLAAMNYEGKLRQVSAKHDTRFLEYRPETGSWVFKVDHFSKYGLSDSDEDDNVQSNSEAKKLKGNAAVTQKMPGQLQEAKTVNKDAPNGLISSANLGNGKHPDVEKSFLGEAIASAALPNRDYSSEKPVALSPSAISARMAGTDSHKLQLMKASFFNENGEDLNEEFFSNDIQPFMQKSMGRSFLDVDRSRKEQQDVTSFYAPVLRSNFTIQQSFSMDDEQLHSTMVPIQKWTEDIPMEVTVSSARPFPEPVIVPITAVLKCHSEVIPFENSIISKLRFGCIADTGMQMGRMFRPSWGLGLTLLSLSSQDQASKMPLQNALSQLGSYVSGRLFGDNTSTVIVQRLQILGGNGAGEEHIQAFKESIEGHLRIQLDHCIMGQEGDCPALGVSTESASVALHAHCTMAQELADQLGADSSLTYSSNVWKLFVSLWGNLPDINVTVGNTRHHNVMVRREAVGEWLRNVVQDTVEQELAEVSTDEERILSYLSALRLEDACQLARKVGDHCLALLMAQLRSGMPVKELIKQQLALWQETNVDENLSIDRLKLFMLLAGEPLISSKHGTINVCEGLDWKRALAVHLWYLSSPIASITDVLDLYEESFNTNSAAAYAAVPTPEYKETDFDAELNDGKPIYDLCFHILKLYCTGNHPLGELLNPLTHTADPLDYRLGWLVQQMLTALGYSHLSEHVEALTHVNFATQLETYGLWHWAIFVMLHLRDTGRRRTAVIHLLDRHIEIDDVPEYVKREQFLREELGIPSTWINRAKAVKSRVSKRYGEAAYYFIQAEQWNMAHEIIIEHLAADAIINENYDYLRSLLSPLLPDECSSTISGWLHQGQLLWDYMEITMEIKSLLRTTDPCGLSYTLELLKPRLTGLCCKINQFPCPTAKHRLCQAEIAKRTLHLAKNLLLLHSTENRSTTKVLVHLVSQLPLPEDYAQQELRPIVNMCVNEVMSQSG